MILSTCCSASSIPLPCQKDTLYARLYSYIERDEAMVFRIIVEQECKKYIDFARDSYLYELVPKILSSPISIESRKQMLTSYAILGCYLPFHRALYKSSVLQPLPIWKMLKEQRCSPNTFYLNVIAQKYPEGSEERKFILNWMMNGLKQGLKRSSSPKSRKLPSSSSLKDSSTSTSAYASASVATTASNTQSSQIEAPTENLKEIKSSENQLEFGYLRGDVCLDKKLKIKTKNIRGIFSLMGSSSVLDRSHIGLVGSRHRLKDYLASFSGMKSLSTVLTGSIGRKIMNKNAPFGFVRFLPESSSIEALLYKDVKLIVLSRDENEDVHFAYPTNPYNSLKESFDELHYISLPIKATDIVLLMRCKSFLPPPAPIDNDDVDEDIQPIHKDLKPHDLSGIFYFCDLNIFDQLFRLLTKHIHDRTQSQGLLVVGGYVHEPTEESRIIISKWNKNA
jgi:hypothetical protein